MIFVNLPVADLARATAFYEALGATVNPEFTGEVSACMVFSETIHVMLLNHARFKDFTPKAISDAKATTEVLLALFADSRAAVDAAAEAASKAGGKVDVVPAQDHGFMYSRSIEDPDGHIWEMGWMDMDAFRKANQPAA